ncbi:MAG: hypothetical protein HOC70_12095 [Gammaproteobacteria bacterium]|jgi:sigma-E factor negative regulatory protein RseB|nr:hypothetical protein [Gammaproteobacteria bacterium]
MINQAVKGFLACALLSASFSEAAVKPAAEDAVKWLDQMGHALRHQNYQGIFTYIRGSTFETVRIVHRNDEGIETERLFNLNGDVRELFRENDEVVCYHPDTGDGELDANHTVQIGPFSPAFSERVISTQNLYRLSMHGEDRIAGRRAITLSISPRFDDRYGYRVWLDKETGLLLQSHKVERGRVREIFQFTSLEIGGEIEDTEMASAIAGDTVSHRLALDLNDQAEKPGLRVSWLPDGFRPVRVQGNRLHFTDGVATFSVFVDRSKGGSMPDMATRVGGTVVITRRLKKSGPQITVVGDVPVQTARRVAESVEPVIY